MNRARWLPAGARALALASSVALLRAQAGEPPVAAEPAQVARAEALLRAHAARCRTAKVVVADYVQRRTTALLKEPLVSKGEFLFVREPAAVLFFAKEPRPSVVRLTETTYEVHRPQKKQLERFHLDGPELSQGLFAAVGGDAERLLKDFVVVACTDGPPAAGTAVVRLAAQRAAVRERLQELVITLATKDAALTSVAYRDHAGDLVEIELGNVRLDPANAPRAELRVDKDTTIVEHPAAKPKPK